MPLQQLYLYDVPPEQFSQLLPQASTAFYASGKTALCKGCFSCWVKTPGACIMRDGTAAFEQLLPQTDVLVIISRCLYGGFSQPVKAVLDRSIPHLLPFFTTRGGQMHHTPRYPRRFSLQAVFYNADELYAEERQTAEDIVRANAINLNATHSSCHFVNTVPAVAEVLI